jgi:hypothetical protein
MLRTFSANPTCRHIIFGGCHDTGYLLNLEQFKHDQSKAARITLLETTPAHRGFAELLHFPRARFETVFKSEPLPDFAPLGFAATTNTFVPAQNTTTPAQSPGLLRSTTNPSPKPSVSSPSPSTPPSSVTGGLAESNGDSTWGKWFLVFILRASNTPRQTVNSRDQHRSSTEILSTSSGGLFTTIS